MTSSPYKQGNLEPKYANYTSNGFGRDTYINYNNGGFHNNVEQYDPKNNYNTFSLTRFYNTKRYVAPLKYRSDGTGRDKYVLHEHGGLEKDTKPLKNYHLKDFLRNEGGNNVYFNNSPMKEGIRPKNLYMSQKEFNIIKNIKILEKNLEERLYKPKETSKKPQYK